MPNNYRIELVDILKSNASNKWQNLYTKLSALSADEDKSVIEDQKSIIEDFSKELLETIIEEEKSSPSTARRGSFISGLMRRPSAAKAMEHDIAAKFITGYSKVLKDHAYPNDSEPNKFNELMIASIISVCIKNKNFDLTQKLLRAFQGPVLLNSIVVVTDILHQNIMDYVKIYSQLGDGSLLKLARQEKALIYKRYLPVFGSANADSAVAAVFIRKIEALQAQMEVAQAWSIQTYVAGSPQELDFELSLGGHTSLDFELRKIVDYIDKHKKDDLITKMLEKLAVENKTELLSGKAVNEILTQSFADLRSVDWLDSLEESKEQDQQFLQDPSKPRYITMGFINPKTGAGHSIAIAFWEDKLCIVNRGGSSKAPRIDGLHVYTLEDKKMREALLGIASDNMNKPQSGEQAVTDFILNFAKPFGTNIPMPPQSVGNCAWVAKRSLSWMAVYFNTLKVMTKNGTVDDAAARSIATVAYKFLTKQRKIETLKEYLQLDQHERGNPELLAGVYIKMRDSKWAKELPDFLQHFSDDTKTHAEKVLESDFSTALNQGNDRMINKLLPQIKESNIDKKQFSEDAFSYTLTAIADDAAIPNLFDLCLRDLQTLVNNGINETELQEYPSLEARIEAYAKDLIDNPDYKLNLENKDKLLKFVIDHSLEAYASDSPKPSVSARNRMGV